MNTPDSIKKFYHSKAWKQVRQYVIKQRRGRCESCGKAGYEVHHIVPLTELNFQDPSVALNPDNLMLLCTSCHDSIRYPDKALRGDLMFTESGDLIEKG